jgi:hypothetical protein
MIYRILKIERDDQGRIAQLVVKTDTGTKLVDKQTMSKKAAIRQINDGAVFYQIDSATGTTSVLRDEPIRPVAPEKKERLGTRLLAARVRPQP